MKLWQSSKGYSFVIAFTFFCNGVFIPFIYEEIFTNSSALQSHDTLETFLIKLPTLFSILSLAFFAIVLINKTSVAFAHIHIKRYLSLWLIIQFLILLTYTLPTVMFRCFRIM